MGHIIFIHFIHVTFCHSTYSSALGCMEIILNLDCIIQRTPICLYLATCMLEKNDFGLVGIEEKVLMGQD